ncbi:phage tail protein [Leptospira sp. WS92.C1]
MSWIQIEPNKFENGSGWNLELDPQFGWIMYHEEIEDEFSDSFIVLADLFGNPGQSVITVDPLTGKIPTTLIPSLAISEVFVTSNQTQMLALNCQRGDLAIRTDIPGPAMFILALDDATSLGSWIQITVSYPDWINIQNKPTQFPPTDHDHNLIHYTKSETDLALSGKRNAGNIPASEISEDSTRRFVSDSEKAQWNDAVTVTPEWNDVQNKPTEFNPVSHNHNDLYYTQAQVDALIAAIPTGSSSGGFDVGDIKTSARNTPATGWLLLNGQTIGNTGSGASNVGTGFQNLYVLLWSDWSNTVLPIQDFSGSATSRGASALADWNAGKRLPLPNLAGRVSMGAGTGSGLTARSLGQSIGEENHLLSLPEIPPHNHGGGIHNHPVNTGGFLANGGSTSIKVGYTSVTKTNTDASAAIINTEGEGLGHNNIQPSLVLNYFIKH